MTDYLVLHFEKTEEEAGTWAILQNRPARSAQSAIRQFIEDQNGEAPEGRYVAVPSRSWKPVTVKVETKTALKFS